MLRSVSANVAVGRPRSNCVAGVEGDEVRAALSVRPISRCARDQFRLFKHEQQIENRAGRHASVLGQRLVAGEAVPRVAVGSVCNVHHQPPGGRLHLLREVDLRDHPVNSGVCHQKAALLRSRANAGRRCIGTGPPRPVLWAGRALPTLPARSSIGPIACPRARRHPTVPLLPHISTGQPDLSRATFASSCEGARNASGGAGRIHPQVRLARAMRARYPMRTPQAATECLFGLACPPGA